MMTATSRDDAGAAEAGAGALEVALGDTDAESEAARGAGANSEMAAAMQAATAKVEIPNKVFFRIGDVASLVGVKAYVLRYWESEFPILSPEKSQSGQRVYRRSDVETLLLIKHLLYAERYSIEGARKRIRELRREGEFKKAREVTVSQVAATSGRISAVKAREIRAAIASLRQTLKTPVSRLFLD